MKTINKLSLIILFTSYSLQSCHNTETRNFIIETLLSPITVAATALHNQSELKIKNLQEKNYQQAFDRYTQEKKCFELAGYLSPILAIIPLTTPFTIYLASENLGGQSACALAIMSLWCGRLAQEIEEYRTNIINEAKIAAFAIRQYRLQETKE